MTTSNASISPQAIASFMRRSRRLTPLLLKTLDRTAVGVGIVDATYRVYYANPAMQGMNEPLNAARVVRQGGRVPENPNRRLASLVERALHQKKTDGLIEVAAPALPDGGAPKAWEVELFPLSDEEGKAFCAMIVRDVARSTEPEVAPSEPAKPEPEPAAEAAQEEVAQEEVAQEEVAQEEVAQEEVAPGEVVQDDAAATLLRGVLDALHTYVAVLDLDGRVQQVNAAALRRAGMESHEAADAPFWETFWWSHDAEQAKRVREAVERAVAGESTRLEARARIGSDPEHDLLDVDVMFTPLRNAAGEVERVVASAYDVTPHKSAIEAAQSAAEEARSADDGKLRAIALLAHELRSPLSAAGMALQLLNIDPKLRPFREADDDVDQAFLAFDRSLTAMRRLIDDLMDFSRLAHGKLSIERKPISLAAVAREAADDCSQEVQDARHRLEVAADDNDTTVEADHGRLKQVVYNLLRNSVRYTEEGGHIRVEVSRQGDEVELKVIDNGRGIPAEHLERLFEPFEQVDPHEGGLGLGLGLCRQLIAAHEGTITAQSEGLGKGATFTIRLPAAGG